MLLFLLIVVLCVSVSLPRLSHTHSPLSSLSSPLPLPIPLCSVFFVFPMLTVCLRAVSSCQGYECDFHLRTHQLVHHLCVCVSLYLSLPCSLCTPESVKLTPPGLPNCSPTPFARQTTLYALVLLISCSQSLKRHIKSNNLSTNLCVSKKSLTLY